MRNIAPEPYCAAVGFGDGITSANIVGYQTSNIKGGIFYMIATPFDGTDGSGAGIAIKDLVTGDIPDGAEMQVRLKAGGYDIYHYTAEAYDEVADDFVPGWADGGDNLVTTPVLKVGRGAWIKPAAAVSVTWESPVK